GDGRARLARALDDGGTRNRGAVGFHEAADAVERLGGDAAAVAQPRGELTVVDGAPAEGRFRKSAVPAIVGDLLQQVLRVHGLYASTFRSDLRAPRLGTAWEGRRNQPTANQARRCPSTTKGPTAQVGRQMGCIPTTEKGRYCLGAAAVGGLHHPGYVGSWEVSHKIVGRTQLKPGRRHRAHAARRRRSRRYRRRRRIRTA